jgi:hypothetical protein
MTCSTNWTFADSDYNEFGLPFGHAYTLLGVVELKSLNGTVEHQLYKIRNPWGIDSYNGTWNDNDNISWTEEYKK